MKFLNFEDNFKKYEVGAAIGISAVVGYSSARKARKAGQRSSSASMALQQQQYNQTREDFKPYREAGGRALTQLEDMLNGNFNYKEDPGYQFRLKEGYRGLEASQAGRRFGGRAAKEAIRYGQGMASQEYGAAYNRRAGGLSSIINAGTGATAGTSAAGQQSANNMTNIYANKAKSEAGYAGNVNQNVQGSLQNLTMWNMYNASPQYGGRTGYGAPSSVINSGDAYMPAYSR